MSDFAAFEVAFFAGFAAAFAFIAMVVRPFWVWDAAWIGHSGEGIIKILTRRNIHGVRVLRENAKEKNANNA